MEIEDRSGSAGLTQIPLEQVEPAWNPGARRRDAAATVDAAGALAPVAATRQSFAFEVHLPFVSVVRAPAPDNQAGCPCGWFAADGRMVDFVPGS